MILLLKGKWNMFASMEAGHISEPYTRTLNSGEIPVWCHVWLRGKILLDGSVRNSCNKTEQNRTNLPNVVPTSGST